MGFFYAIFFAGQARRIFRGHGRAEISGAQVFKTRVRMTRFPNEGRPDPSPKPREIVRRRHAVFNVSAIPSGDVGKGLAERLVVLVKLQSLLDDGRIVRHAAGFGEIEGLLRGLLRIV